MSDERPQSHIPSGTIVVDRSNFDTLTQKLPHRARMMIAVIMEMPKGSLLMETPEGLKILLGNNSSGPNAHIKLHNWNVAGRAFMEATIGVAESYMDGDWESHDITTLLELFVINEDAGEAVAGGASWLLTTIQRLRHWLNENTRAGSKRNISAHYDLGNKFYNQWLDPSMTYSSALYQTGANDLETAQAAKYRALANDTGIGSNDHVLEIGCGWGGFAEFAAREIGCKVTGLTISRQQYDFAKERIAKAGLSERVDIRLQDYRDETGLYDRIASIEMFEAVGEKYWPIFFEKIRECLKPGGSAGMQIITIKENAFERYRLRPDFIQRYIFPGGMLPTPKTLKRLGEEYSLNLMKERIFPQDYARTLYEWRKQFLVSWERIKPLGFDERFKRLWEFYLHYCEAGFRAEYIDVRHVIYKG